MAGGELLLDRVILEVRFPRRLSFMDHIGRLADGFEESFDEASISALEVRLTSELGGEVVLAPDRIVVEHGKGDKEWALTRMKTALSLYGKEVGTDMVEYAGARQVLLLYVGTVSDATAAFRATFFNYKEGPLAAFGESPIEAQARVGFRVGDGTCHLVATAVARPLEDGDERRDEEPPGALLLDVDRASDLGIDLWSAAEEVERLLTDGYARAVHFISGLKGDQLSPDAGRE